MRPDEPNDALYSFCHRVFTGTIRHQWIDQSVDRVFSLYRVVHENRANLFLKWIHNRFPELPLLFLVRHPCAVVLSRMENRWATDGDIEPFLAQRELIDDFLFDKLHIIQSANTDEEKHAIIWCVHHLVPIQQFHPGGLNTIFYENLCVQPELEIEKIFQILEKEYRPSVFRYLDIPSITVQRASVVLAGGNKIARWTEQLSSEQVHRILAIVKEFGLDYIYGDSLTPVISRL
jgi:hypothetical protein